jgi:hypothetical protein
MAVTATVLQQYKARQQASGRHMCWTDAHAANRASYCAMFLMHQLHKFYEQMQPQAYQCAAALLLCKEQRQHGLERQQSQASKPSPDMGAAVADGDSRGARVQTAAARRSMSTLLVASCLG